MLRMDLVRARFASVEDSESSGFVVPAGQGVTVARAIADGWRMREQHSPSPAADRIFWEVFSFPVDALEPEPSLMYLDSAEFADRSDRPERCCYGWFMDIPDAHLLHRDPCEARPRKQA